VCFRTRGSRVAGFWWGSLLESKGLDGREGDLKLILREKLGQETDVAWGWGGMA